MITGPCRVCGVTTKAPAPAELLCGQACEYLRQHREKYADVQPGHREHIPINATQRALHRKALRQHNGA